jgi:hypothetical protein
VAALLAALASCGGDAPSASCVAGRSVACACTNGRSGAQACTDAGVFGPCVCSDGLGDASNAAEPDASFEPRDVRDGGADATVPDVGAAYDAPDSGPSQPDAPLDGGPDAPLDDGPTSVGCTIAGVAKIPGRADHRGITVNPVGSGITGTTNADGSYRLTNVPPGTYRLELRGDAYEEVIPEVICGAAVPALVVNEGKVFTIPPLTLVRGHRVVHVENTGFIMVATDPSPDGRNVIYWGSSPTSGATSLATVNGMGAVTTLVDGGLRLSRVEANPDWSRLLVVSPDPSALYFKAAVYSLPSSGGALTRLGAITSDDARVNLQLSEDRKFILLYDNGITVAPTSGGPAVALTTSASPNQCRFTHDGTAILCSVVHTVAPPRPYDPPMPRFTISRWPVTGGPGTEFTADGAHEQGADISPDGSTAAFVSTTNGVTRLLAVPSTGGPARDLAAARAGAVAFAPDGRIVYLSEAGFLSWIDSSGTDRGTIALASTARDIQFGASGSVIFTSTGLIVGSLTGAEAIVVGPVPRAAGGSAADPILTADRRWLVGDGGGQVVSVSLEARTRIELASQSLRLAVSPDGNWIVSLNNARSQLWLSRIDGTSARNLGSGGDPAIFSPASKSLVFPAVGGLYAMPLADSPTLVVGSPDDHQEFFQFISWVDELHFTFSRATAGNDAITFTHGVYLGSVP